MLDLFGYAAYAFVLLSTLKNDAVWFRSVMAFSNLCFIAYGFALGLLPVLFFNIVLLAMNGLQAARAWHNAAPRVA